MPLIGRGRGRGRSLCIREARNTIHIAAFILRGDASSSSDDSTQPLDVILSTEPNEPMVDSPRNTNGNGLFNFSYIHIDVYSFEII